MLCCIAEKGAIADAAGSLALAALPESFKAWKAAIAAEAQGAVVFESLPVGECR
jgi:hypothetical protein